MYEVKNFDILFCCVCDRNYAEKINYRNFCDLIQDFNSMRPTIFIRSCPHRNLSFGCVQCKMVNRFMVQIAAQIFTEILRHPCVTCTERVRINTAKKLFISISAASNDHTPVERQYSKSRGFSVLRQCLNFIASFKSITTSPLSSSKE